jgi:tetratricopeptide (TPR) repeat protein
VPEPAAGAAPAHLPAAPAGFTGRERQLKRLDELLVEAGRGLRVVVVSGMAGVGKTALAVHWGQRVRDRFPDGQLYVNLRGYASSSPVRPVAALAGFLQALGVAAEQVPVEPEPAAAQYRSLLADRRMLVVLDNASSIEQVRPLLPGGSGCLVLVTSRERLAGLVALEGAGHLDLAVLDPGEAGELLAWVVGAQRVEAEPAAVAELARWCGFLPLALRVAAANLALHPQRRIAAQAAQLAGGDRLAALAVDQDEQTAVRVAFDHSYTGLPAEARRLFRLLGLVPGPHVTADAAAALGGTTRAEASRLLNRLASAHLMDQPAPGRYTLHDLVRLYAADRAEHEETTEDRQAATERLFDWYLQTADAAGRLLNPETLRLPPLEEAAPQPARFDDHQQALAWLDDQRPNLLAAVQHAAEHGLRPVAWRLADTLRGYYYLRMYTLDWLVVAGAGLAAAEAGEDLPAQAAAEHSLADLHRRIGQFQRAIEHYTRASTRSQQAGWLEGQTSTLGGLGTTYFHLGRLPESAEHFTQALALASKHGQTTRQAARLGNLGLVYWLQGRLQQAADQHTQALALSRQLGSRRNEAVGLANLGESYHSLGRFDDALGCLTTALALHRELGDRGGEAEALCVLAAVHRDAGRHRHALESAQAAVALSRDTGERPTEASAMATLATVHGCAAQYAQAIDHHQQALALARETDTRYAEMTALIGLAVAYRQLANNGDAESFARHGLALAEQGGYRVVEGQAHTALAGVHLDLDEPDQAIEHAERAIAIQQETGHRLGEARARQELGNVLHRNGNAETAAASWQRANRILTEIGSPEATQPPP